MRLFFIFSLAVAFAICFAFFLPADDPCLGGELADQSGLSGGNHAAYSLPSQDAPISRRAESGIPVPVEVSRILPGLKSLPQDWREHAPQEVTIVPVSGEGAMRFKLTRLKQTANQTTWVGRDPITDASLVSVGTAKNWFAVVLTKSGIQYDIYVDSASALVSEAAQGACAIDSVEMPVGGAGRVVPETHPNANIETEASHRTYAELMIRREVRATDDVSVLEVLFFYDATLERDIVEGYIAKGPGGELILYPGRPVEEVPEFLSSVYRAYVETCNAILERSNVPNLRWSFLGMIRAADYPLKTKNGGPYDGNGTSPTFNPYDMVNDSTFFTFEGTSAEFTKKKVNESGADIAVLVVGGVRQLAGTAGGAFDSYQIMPQAVVRFTFAATNLAHEIGHNFGLGHDRETGQVPDGGGYNYGYRFKYADAITSFMAGDLMSYSNQMPFFSNPDIIVDRRTIYGVDDPTVVLPGPPDDRVYPLGVPAGQPKAADAARWLREKAAMAAAYRDPPASALPQLTSHPVSAVTKTGADATFTVQVSGSSPFHIQWRVSSDNGATWSDISDEGPYDGTQTAVLRITNVPASFAGNRYKAVVSNERGSTSSSSAVLYLGGANTGSRLVALAARCRAGREDQTLIMGFVVGGSGNKEILLRGIGPGIASSVPSALADPQLKLFRYQNKGFTQLDENNDWANTDAMTEAFARLGAASLAAASKDAAMLKQLTNGVYTAHVTTSGPAGIALVEAFDADGRGDGKLMALSTRTVAGTGDDTLIVGMVIEGSGTKQVLIRGLGPTLASRDGVSGVLSDPRLKLFRTANGTSTLMAENDNWGGTTELKDVFSIVGAGPLESDGSKDAAMLATLSAGVYSVHVTGATGSGVALVEIFDLP